MTSSCIWGISTLLWMASLDGNHSPELVHIGTVSPSVIGITVQAGHVEYGRQVPYARQDGDVIKPEGKERVVLRGGKPIGWLVGRDGNLLYTPDELIGEPLDTDWADAPDSYAVSSPDDSDFARDTMPATVYRKSKPTDFGRWFGWPYVAPVQHVIYLKMPTPLKPGRTYRLAFRDDRFGTQAFVHDPASRRSEAVHVSQVGFRPDDPAKRAFLSCWLGSGGPMKYPNALKFSVLEDTSGKSVWEGSATLAKAGDDKTEDAYKKNYAGVDVYELDFSPLQQPGRYRIYVTGVGCSYSFDIGEHVWRDAFSVSARGFYHQRSGVELGPPYTTFRRPRCFYPDDGVRILASTCPLMDSGNGLNARGTDRGNFGNLVKGKTDRVVENAWGGYMDAGDWDRRIQHLIVSRYLIELAELYPDYFASLSLNIPESQNQLPDVVDEALFNLDCYRRMQTNDGGIRGGIESAEHPRHGEASWQESLDVMAYAPGAWSSYVYAGNAAQASHWLLRRDAALAQTYRDSALRAMHWAEGEYARLQQASDWSQITQDARNKLRDERNLAAVELFRLTGDQQWHKLFLQTTKFDDPNAELTVWQSHDQAEAAWVYLRTERPGKEENVMVNCRAALLRQADDRSRSVERSGFRIAKDQWRPGAWGAFAAPDAVSLVRAHFLTGDRKYLTATVLACQHGVGANPVNMCYTTGLGQVSPQHPLHIDSRITHQPPPAGLTVFGPTDVTLDKDNWAQKIVAGYCYPSVQSWPTLEAFWDVFWYPSICEFTVQSPMAANAYAWGYLAARGSAR